MGGPITTGASLPMATTLTLMMTSETLKSGTLPLLRTGIQSLSSSRDKGMEGGPPSLLSKGKLQSLPPGGMPQSKLSTRTSQGLPKTRRETMISPG